MEDKSAYILVENDFLYKGVCKYLDGFGNKVVMARSSDGKGFRAKLILANRSIKAASIVVNLPIPEVQSGNSLRLEYPPETNLDSEDIRSGVTMLQDVIDRWVDLHAAIARLSLQWSVYEKANPGVSREDIAEHRFREIMSFEEVHGSGNEEILGMLEGSP